ncbi:hypothetical protein, partial [Providencia rustigianii]
ELFFINIDANHKITLPSHKSIPLIDDSIAIKFIIKKKIEFRYFLINLLIFCKIKGNNSK